MSKISFAACAVVIGAVFSSAAQSPSRVSPEVAKSVFHHLHQLAAGAEQYYLENQKSEVTYAELVGQRS